MNPSPADGTIGSPVTPDFEACLSPMNGRGSEEFEIIDACFDSGRSASSSLPSPTASASHSRGSSDSSTTSHLTPNKNSFCGGTETVETLKSDQIRWFYKEDRDKKWTPFIGYDSLRIESSYQDLHQWMDSVSPTDSTFGPTATSSPRTSVGRPRVTVRGGLYEADVANRKTYSIYWNDTGEPSLIMRGTWFMDYTWQPIEESYADEIEAEHLRLFQEKTEADAENKTTTSVLHTLKFCDFSVEWAPVDNKVYLHSEATTSKFYRAVGNKLGLGKGTRLRRAYSTQATMDDRPPDISHLVFVIHGIGQKMDTGSIAKSCADLRETCSKVIKNFPEIIAENKRAEFLPVEWRSSLKLDGDAVESITPNKVRGLRTLLNASAMDILYYTSPLYRSEIINGLQTELNRLYDMFCEHHPRFQEDGGKISVIAHSLGVVIVYDILMGWNPVQLYDQYVTSILKEEAERKEASALVTELEIARNRVHQLEEELKKTVYKYPTPSLNFSLENMFCLGSPLAVFLVLRGVRPMGLNSQNHILPRSLCSRLYNVYHPSDPVAYRLEPLILKHYSTLAPVQIHRHDQLDKPLYEDMPAEAMASSSPASRPAPLADRAGGNKDDGDGDSTDSAKDLGIDEEPKGRLSGVWSLWSRKTPSDEVYQEMTPLRKEPDKEVGSEQGLERANKAPATEAGGGRGWLELGAAGPSMRHEPLMESDMESEGDDAGPELFVDAVDGTSVDNMHTHPLKALRHVTGEDGVSVDDAEEAREDSLLDQTELEWRIDYQLKEGKMESAYLATLTAHTAYWINLDIGVFILSQLFPPSKDTTS